MRRQGLSSGWLVHGLTAVIVVVDEHVVYGIGVLVLGEFFFAFSTPCGRSGALYPFSFSAATTNSSQL